MYSSEMLLCLYLLTVFNTLSLPAVFLYNFYTNVRSVVDPDRIGMDAHALIFLSWIRTR
jgi:hypothetical protein